MGAVDQELQILIRFGLDPANAKKAKQEIDALRDATAEFAKITGKGTEATKDDAKATEKSTLSKAEQKKVIQELSREFPILGMAAKAAMSPQVVAITSVILLYREATKALDEWNKRMDEIEEAAAKPFFNMKQALFDAHAELKNLRTASDEFVKAQLEDDEKLTRQMNNRIGLLKKQVAAYLELLKAEEEKEVAAAPDDASKEAIRAKFVGARSRVTGRLDEAEITEREAALARLRKEAATSNTALSQAQASAAEKLLLRQTLQKQVDKEQGDAPAGIAQLKVSIEAAEKMLSGTVLGGARVAAEMLATGKSQEEVLKQARQQLDTDRVNLQTLLKQQDGEAGGSKAALRLKALNEEQERYKTIIKDMSDRTASLNGQIKTLEQTIADLKESRGINIQTERGKSGIDAGTFTPPLPPGQTPFERSQSALTAAGAGAARVLAGGATSPDEAAIINSLLNSIGATAATKKQLLKLLSDVMADGVVTLEEVRQLQKEFAALRAKSGRF